MPYRAAIAAIVSPPRIAANATSVLNATAYIIHFDLLIKLCPSSAIVDFTPSMTGQFPRITSQSRDFMLSNFAY
jgi:hypothetical protein